MTRSPVGCLILSVNVKGYAFEKTRRTVNEEAGERSQFIRCVMVAGKYDGPQRTKMIAMSFALSLSLSPFLTGVPCTMYPQLVYKLDFSYRRIL